jgi:hypothetical protein
MPACLLQALRSVGATVGKIEQRLREFRNNMTDATLLGSEAAPDLSM